MKRIVIFTDLDGTLLHPKTYSFDTALPALSLIREKNIPLILCSSKTRAEIEVYKPRLGNDYPFISENGGGIFIPEGYFSQTIHKALFCKAGSLSSLAKKGEKGVVESPEVYYVISLGKPYEEIRKVFSDLRERLNIKVKGFGDMTEKDIAELTGLTVEEASLAKLRDFGEPFVFDGNPDESFLNAIEASGLNWTQGHFYHVMGDNDKGKAVSILKGLFEREHGEIHTIALGDGFNDLPMLKEVDQPVLIPKEDGSYDRRVTLPGMIKAKGIGPDGWNKVLMELLQGMR